MGDPERDEPETAEDVEDLDLQPGEVEEVKGGTGPNAPHGGVAPPGG